MGMFHPGRRLFLHSSCEMQNYRNSFGCFSTIIPRKEIPSDQLNIFPTWTLIQQFLQTVQTAGRPNETAEIAKTIFEQNLNNLYTNKTARSGDQNTVFGRGDVFQGHYSD